MTASTDPQNLAHRLTGQLVGISISDSDDLPRLGFIPAHLERALAEVATLLAAAGARIGYGGHLEARGFTHTLFWSIANLYGSLRIATDEPPCVHYLASTIWSQLDAERLFEHLWALDGTTEVVLVAVGGLAYSLRLQREDTRSHPAAIRLRRRLPRAVPPTQSTTALWDRARHLYDAAYTWHAGHVPGARPSASFPPVNSPSEQSTPVHMIGSVPELGHFLRHYGDHIAQSKISDASSFSELRLFMAADEDARVVLGGKTRGYSGHFPGIAEESLYSLLAGRRLVALRGFGGCAEDVAHTLLTGEPPPRAGDLPGNSAVFAALAAAATTFLNTLSRSGLAETYTETAALDSPRAMATGVLRCLRERRWREVLDADVDCFRDALL